MGEIRNIIGENIRIACEVKGIRQIDIAEHMGISQGSVSNWVKGNNSIDIEKLVELCNYLGVTLDQIYGLKPIKPDNAISEEQKNIRETLAKKLRECRENAGYTTKEVAQAIERSDKTVNAWEHGRGQPDADTLYLLFKLFKVENIGVFYGIEMKSDELTNEEKSLVCTYRSLNSETRKLVTNMINTFAGNPSTQEEPSVRKAIS